MPNSANPYEPSATAEAALPTKRRRPLWLRLLCLAAALYPGLMGVGLLATLVIVQLDILPVPTSTSGDPVFVQSGWIFVEADPFVLEGFWQILGAALFLLIIAAGLVVWAFRGRNPA